MHWLFGPTAGRPGVVTVHVYGTPEDVPLLRLADALEQHTASGTTVVLDLNGLVLTSAHAMRGFIARVNELGIGPHLVVVCNRSTGRRLLRRWVASSMPVVAEHVDAPLGRPVRPPLGAQVQ